VKIAFLGDVVGKSGRRALEWAIPRIRSEHSVDVVIANAENSAGGFGIEKKGIDEMVKAGVDFFTTGNHIWDKRQGIPLLDERDNILRPANYPGAPGRGSALIPGTDGLVGVINVQGRVFMPPLDCPFRTVDRLLEEMDVSARIIIVDVHAEATSEKIAMGWHLDGKVSMVLGTHTHVPTADQRILPGGTAYVTDVGMTGPYDGILGVRKEAVIERFYDMRPKRFEVAKDDLRCDYVVAEIDEQTGKANTFEHLQMKVEE
jgi:metallophosphoesterase (TIGR00282 family)